MSSPIDSFAIITINAAVTDLQNIKINYSRFRQEAVLLCMDSVINRFLRNYLKQVIMIMSDIVENVFFSFDMPSNLRRKRVTKFESKFTDFYGKCS